MTIWFDVGDLIRFFQGAARPTGIQRFSLETCRAAAAIAEPGEVRFCARNTLGTGLREVDFPALDAAIASLANARDAAPPSPRTPPPQPGALARAAMRLDPRFRLPLGQLTRAAKSGIAATRDLAAACHPSRRRPSLHGEALFRPGGDIRPGPGDWVVHLGASWERPYPAALRRALAASGSGVALLAHDMIPALFPEWCTAAMVRSFAAWLQGPVPQADLMFAVSRNTAHDLSGWLAARGQFIAPPVVLPPGGIFRHAAPEVPPLLAEPYVLMVGTIEARKNHAAMLRVWRRLLSERGPGDVPVLVFAGKPGWLTTDLLQQLENADYLGGKIRHIPGASDAELASLYQHCLFSVFPSLYEGWGLPVTESLSFGQPAAAACRGAIPEAGGAFCAYFDPDDISSIHGVITQWLNHPEEVAALRARIRAHFTPPSWTSTAAALLDTLAARATAPAAPDFALSAP